MTFKTDKKYKYHYASRKSAFTLLQVLVVLGLFGLMLGFSTLAFGAYKGARASAQRSNCDAHLKTIALALETFRQDQKRMPKNLGELVEKEYVTADMLRCPADPDAPTHSDDLSYSSYSKYYVLREPRDSDDLLVILCPFHEGDGIHGEQAFKGGYTKQFKVRQITLAPEDYSGVLQITRPGTGVLPLPTQGEPPLVLHGGDALETGAGSATIHFADGSTANLESNTELTVLQSCVQGQQSGHMYSLVNQFIGRVNYYVNPGSNFDVATPTATAGALGTRFSIIVAPVNPTSDYPYNTETYLIVQEHKVAFTTVDRTIVVTDTDPMVAAHDPANAAKPRRPRGAPGSGTFAEDNSAGGSTTGGSTSGSTTGGSTSGSTTGGSTSGGTTTSGTTTSGTTTSGTTTSGTTTSGTTTSGTTTSGTTTSGTTTSGTTTSGGTTDGTTTSGTTTSGTTTSGGTTGGTTTGGTTTSGSTLGGSTTTGGSTTSGTTTSGSTLGGSTTTGTTTSGSTTGGNNGNTGGSTTGGNNGNNGGGTTNGNNGNNGGSTTGGNNGNNGGGTTNGSHGNNGGGTTNGNNGNSTTGGNNGNNGGSTTSGNSGNNGNNGGSTTSGNSGSNSGSGSSSGPKPPWWQPIVDVIIGGISRLNH